MLSVEDNELLTRVGPGTVMGALFRQYWVPALLASELPGPDCDPVRVMLLGEKLIGFRDSLGRVGLVSEVCPHRGASLYFGRNEECGLRCVYHGWKFDVSGACTDMPAEPPASTFKNKVKVTAYPCVERAGLVWAYLGPRSEPPPLPRLEATELPDGEWRAAAVQRECSWLQAIEGDLDTSHVGLLHLGATKPEEAAPGSFEYYTVRDRAPKYAAIDTPYGAMYGAYRPAGPGEYYWRIAQFLFPFYVHIPIDRLGLQRRHRAFVPMDDHHSMFFGFSDRRSGDKPSVGPLKPNGTGWFDRFVPEADIRNEYNLDRAWQREDSYTGIRGIHLEDQAITESMGPVVNRNIEHLGTSDVMVIRIRRRLLAAARALAENGTTPPGVDDPDAYQVRSGGIILPQDADWIEATKTQVNI
jgi:phthalate 4,5-dioxygenase